LGLRLFGLGGTQALTLLNHVAKDSYLDGGTVLGGVLECEDWPRSKVPSFDGFDPCRFDWEASSCMEVPYQSLNVR